MSQQAQQVEQAETKEPLLTAAMLLGRARKTVAKKPAAGLLWDGEPDVPAEVLHGIRALKETERTLAADKDRLLDIVLPWYRERIRTDGYEATVRFICAIRPDGKAYDELRMAVIHRYSAIPAERECELRKVVGGKFDMYFSPAATLKLKKEVADDPELLEVVVLAVAQAIGPEKFAAWFESTQTLACSRAFTERRFTELSDEQNARLEQAGVKQVISFSDSSKD